MIGTNSEMMGKLKNDREIIKNDRQIVAIIFPYQKKVKNQESGFDSKNISEHVLRFLILNFLSSDDWGIFSECSS